MTTPGKQTPILDRRAFVRVAGSAVGSLLVAPSAARAFAVHTSRTHPEEIILRGGLVYDGTGAPPANADVVISGDRIGRVGRISQITGAAEVDLHGLVLAPGFIDIHSHTDFELFIDGNAHGKIRQGVTSEVVGQDGSSMGPWGAEQASGIRERYRAQYGVDIAFDDVPGFLAQLERRGMAVNIASMIGHGTVRAYVMGTEDRPATVSEHARMAALVAKAVNGGACGLSTGLEYIPGAFADLSELTRLAAVLRGTGLPYATHMRNEDDELIAAIEEALNIGRGAGVPVHISHLKAQGERNWWKAEPLLRMLEAAQAKGLEVSYDRYPYVAYSTGLSSLFPVWARNGGTDAFLARLRNSPDSDRVATAVQDKIALLGSWDAVQITSTASQTVAWAHGRRLGELARARGVEPYELLLEIVISDRNRVRMAGFGMSEENTARFLAHPLGMICSDGAALATTGPLASGTPHPRNYGTYPRVLGHYCRDSGLMSFETAIHKMTGAPAARLQLAGRGVIAAGAFADLVAFEPDRVADRATFDDPHRYPEGILHVMVNGTFVVRDGEHTGEMPGQVLRPRR